jgi:hypothetical protein
VLVSTTSRKITALVRWGISAWVLAAIVTQIWSEVANDAFYPERYFSYFTIQSSLINIVAFAFGGYLAWTTVRDTRLFTIVRVSVFSYAIVTGVVYNLLLRNIPSEGYEPPAWCNESTHVWVPIVIVLEWLHRDPGNDHWMVALPLLGARRPQWSWRSRGVHPRYRRLHVHQRIYCTADRSGVGKAA